MSDNLYVILNKAYVYIISEDSYTFTLLENELGEYFTVTRDAGLLASDCICIGSVEFYSSEGLYESTLAEYANCSYTEFYMHKPKNTKNEDRIGRISKEDGLTIVDSVTKKSVIVCDYDKKVIKLYNSDLDRGSKEVRRIVRDQLLVPYYESRGAIVMHSSAFCRSESGTLVVGSSGSGKTTVYMEALNRADSYRFLTCERTLIIPEESKLLMKGIPEQINFFPGSFDMYEETRSLTKGISQSDFWKRSYKIKTKWRKVLQCFGAEVASGPVALKKICLPKYMTSDLQAQEFIKASYRELVDSEVLTFNDTIRPNWLAWYVRDDTRCKRTIDMLLEMDCEKLLWNKREDIAKFLDKAA
ncbi:hypothetical protein [Saccharospirillum mangrovi]|uniref:hypothetical protein n=1 Tax=Saccharospirillum mangrovi TaxID=2161747 RepID=UPI0013004830|nr:hypothetical protein [Saccharospirillum mangrovi]